MILNSDRSDYSKMMLSLKFIVYLSWQRLAVSWSVVIKCLFYLDLSLCADNNIYVQENYHEIRLELFYSLFIFWTECCIRPVTFERNG